MIRAPSYGTERFETTVEEDDLDRSSYTIDDEDQGFIVGGRRLLKPTRITGSLVSRNEFMVGSVEAPGMASLMK